MITTARTPETRERALRRLLEVARESGVELKRDEHGEYWATSVSEPGRLYPVTPDSCGCRGYQMHRHCRHVATLWSHLGYFDPEPEPTTGVTVHHVAGHYSLPGLDDDGGEWVEPSTSIALDGVDKVRVTGDTFALSVHWIEAGQPIDDLTGCTPSYLDHLHTVEYWIASLDATVPAWIVMQDADLVAPEELYDAHPLAA